MQNIQNVNDNPTLEVALSYLMPDAAKRGS
jgi:hypothetical protein